jgi:hypothetical protein
MLLSNSFVGLAVAQTVSRLLLTGSVNVGFVVD